MASITLITSLSAENALASICPPMCVADIDEEEVGEQAATADNASIAAGVNETGTGNMTGTNPTG